MLMIAVTYLVGKGVGIWGINIPVAWGFAITNFVWWIGIGHAGTLISAILLLLHQSWRNSINRFAEAMTLFAVACAGLFPLLHLGRPWLFQQAAAALKGEPIPSEPTLQEQKQCMLRHYELVCRRFGQEKGTLLMRKFGCNYAQGKHGARFFRTHVAGVSTREEFLDVVERYFPREE